MGTWVLAQHLSLTSFMSLPNICVLWLVLWTSRKGNRSGFGCEASCQALCKSNSIYGRPWVREVSPEFGCFFFVCFLFICFVFAICESVWPEYYKTTHIVSNSFSILMFLLFSHSVMSNSLLPHGLQHASLPWPLLIPRICSNSCPLSWWCHPTISSSVAHFSCPQSFTASGSFSMSQLFTSNGQNIGASASVLIMNIQGWFPLGWTGWISL